MSEEPKKVLLRFDPKTRYAALVRAAADESVAQNRSISVPKLCYEIITKWLDEREKKERKVKKD